MTVPCLQPQVVVADEPRLAARVDRAARELTARDRRVLGPVAP